METNPLFRHHLQNELIKRAKKNARFSIRSFARQLGVEPSSLAQILAGKRSLTDRMCARIANKLGLSPSQLSRLMRRENSSSIAYAGFKVLKEDAFKVVSDWYYYAILELTQAEFFQGSISFISNTLGISTAEARAAVERLKRLGYLKIDELGRWHDCMGKTTNTGNDHSAAAFREHQKQILTKATDALSAVPYEERVQSSLVLVGSQERVAEAKRRILNFIEETGEYLKGSDQQDTVYALSVSLFPLSKTISKVSSPNQNQKNKPTQKGVPHDQLSKNS